MNKGQMLPDHPQWEDFITRLAGPEGINARFEIGYLTLECDHSGRMAFTSYLLAEYAGIDVEASVAWFRGQGWRCDCEVLFCSDSTPQERKVWRAKRAR